MKHIIHWQYGCYESVESHVMGEGHTSSPPKDWLSTQIFWIFEGNFSCDCNRSLFMAHLPCGELGCGDDIIFHRVDFYRDGRYMGWDTEVLTLEQKAMDESDYLELVLGRSRGNW